MKLRPTTTAVPSCAPAFAGGDGDGSEGWFPGILIKDREITNNNYNIMITKNVHSVVNKHGNVIP